MQAGVDIGRRQAAPGSTPCRLPVFSPPRLLPETSMRMLLTNATLIDCVHPQPIQGATVLIEDGRIREIRNDGNQIDAGDALEINLGGGYLMPGLWDVHIHPDYHSLSDM